MLLLSPYKIFLHSTSFLIMEIKKELIAETTSADNSNKLFLYRFVRDYDNSYYHTDAGFPIIKAPMTPAGTIQICESYSLMSSSSHVASDMFDKVRVHYQLLPSEIKITNVYGLNLQANLAVFSESKHVELYDIGKFGTACYEFDAVELTRLIRNHF